MIARARILALRDLPRIPSVFAAAAKKALQEREQEKEQLKQGPQRKAAKVLDVMIQQVL